MSSFLRGLYIYLMFTSAQLILDSLSYSRVCVDCCTSTKLASFWHGVPPAITSLFNLPCPPSLHLTKRVDECLGTVSSDESRVRSGHSHLFHMFLQWAWFPEWISGHILESGLQEKKPTNTCSFALGFSLKQMNPWCMKRLSGKLKEAECWYKAGHLLLHAPMWVLFSWVKQGLARQAVPL